ncbi:hypothetical protein F5Y10DRAFT_140565 [Nemania abortiva]|nr:hypothetical protein F5Y10DRAFT_140565 [Nemania abortiva]
MSNFVEAESSRSQSDESFTPEGDNYAHRMEISQSPSDRSLTPEGDNYAYGMERPSPRRERAEAITFDSQLLTAQHLRFYNMRVSPFAFALAHPVALKLELIDCYWDMTAQIPVSNNVAARVIRLVGTHIDWKGFSNILTRLPNLHTLFYCRPAREDDTHFDMIGSELSRCGQRIEHLTMLNENYMPFSTPIGSLKDLNNLRSLEIDLEMLIGFLDNPDNYDYGDGDFIDMDEEDDYEEIHQEAGNWSLINLLPCSLETLKLHIDDTKLDVYFDTYERYGAKIEELITADDVFPNLRFIDAPHLMEVAERLSGRHAAWTIEGSGIRRLPFADQDEDSDSPELTLAESHGDFRW